MMQDTSTTWSERILTFAMVCSVWTSLRIGSVVGISEIIILVLGFFTYRKSERPEDARYYKYQDRFLRNVLIAIPLGVAWNLIAIHNNAELLHDLFAFVFTYFLITRVLDKAELFDHLPGITLCFLTLTLATNMGYIALYATGRGMYMGERFEGLSLDPNQLAEVEFLVPWLGIYCLGMFGRGKVKRKAAETGICIASIATSIYIGLLTDSDSYVLATAAGTLTYVVVETWRQLRTRRNNHIILLLVVVALALLVINQDLVVSYLTSYFDKTAADSNQLDLRRRLWLNGLRAFIQSPIFGIGPGAHSGGWHPFGGAEPHNTYVYILMDFGLIGFVSLMAIFRHCWRMIRRPVPTCMTAAFVAFIIFCFFHSFQRMPLFWFYIYFFISSRIYEERCDSSPPNERRSTHEVAVHSRQ